ncbi:MAG: DUF1127 domain-containing protein [Gammaproteobacteria bacterium]|nr:DUF1127 domain-containing protein [Gammaproteobacteria bacterium]
MSTLKAKHFHFIDDMDVAAKVFASIERVEAFAARVNDILSTWSRRSADRRALAMMSDRMLQDIGLSRGELDREVAKFFWQK